MQSLGKFDPGVQRPKQHLTQQQTQHAAKRRRTCTAAADPHAQQQAARQPALLYDFHDQLVPYDQAWSWQKQRVADLCSADTQDTRDTVFLLQHPPVYTLGAGSSEEHVKFDLQHPPHPLYRTERGGEVTYHGPGQLVMYPILNLNRHSQDLHWYLRGLEEVIIRALADTSGLQGGRVPGMTGVWVEGHKLAAIGVRARKWVTYHGLALNVSADLSPFKLITPCGIADKPVGSVKTALGMEQRHSKASSSSSSNSSGSQAASIPQLQLDAIVQDPLITEYRYALLEALEDVFGLQLQPARRQQMQLLLEQGRDTARESSAAGAANSTWAQGPKAATAAQAPGPASAPAPAGAPAAAAASQAG